jgi:chemotaxis protein methyltransferase CheR
VKGPSTDPYLVPEPTNREFAAFRAFVHESAGIYLNESKKALLHSRLVRRVRELGLSTFADYYDLVAEDAAEQARLLDRITTNETHFFREPHHFAFLEQTWIPELVATSAVTGERRVRAWSAGCSTGEEPYSLAMTLLAALPDWTIEILATDLSTRVLDVAERATWSSERADAIPEALRRRFMLRGVGANTGFERASPELRARVTVKRLNLARDPYPATEFDLVFCRNVLIYFHPEERQRALERLVGALKPRGALFVGHAESAHGVSQHVQCVRPTIYQRRDLPRKPRLAR